jgi:hypothetical protein
MSFLKDLLAARDAAQAPITQIAEASGRQRSMDELIDKWQDMNRYYHFEGERGVRALEALTKAIGYRGGLHEFLADNSGAITAIFEWIKELGSSEWIEALEDEVGPDEDHHDGDDDEDDHQKNESIREGKGERTLAMVKKELKAAKAAEDARLIKRLEKELTALQK